MDNFRQSIVINDTLEIGYDFLVFIFPFCVAMQFPEEGAEEDFDWLISFHFMFFFFTIIMGGKKDADLH